MSASKVQFWSMFWILVVALIMIALAIGRRVPCPVPTPVICHAPSEDSDMTDCDYRNGGWYPR